MGSLSKETKESGDPYSGLRGGYFGTLPDANDDDSHGEDGLTTTRLEARQILALSISIKLGPQHRAHDGPFPEKRPSFLEFHPCSFQSMERKAKNAI